MNILIVEDDKEIVSSLISSLKERGFAVDAAFDGNTGLEKAQKNNYDLIILDYELLVSLPLLRRKETFEVYSS